LTAGFAFAWADVLLEVGTDLTIRRAEGALTALFDRTSSELVATSLMELFADTYRETVKGLAALDPGTRLTVDNVGVNPGYRTPVANVTLAALRLEAPSDVLCVAIRAVPPQATWEQPPAKTATTEEIEAFARQAGRDLRRHADNGVSLVSVTRLDALKPRLRQADAVNLGGVLRAIVGEAIGANAPWIALDEGTFAYVTDTDASDRVPRALQDATKELDPEGIGADVDQGAATLVDGIDESDFVNGLVCSLSRFCHDAPCDDTSSGPSLDDFVQNFDRLVTDGISEVQEFADLVRQRTFDLAMQPIVEARRGKIHHYEVLCRFPDGGSPASKLSFAEKARLIHQFDLAMLQRVMRWLAERRRGRARPVVAVNISGHSLTHPGFVEAVEGILDEHPLLQKQLLFEITETLPIRDRQQGNSLIQRLRRRDIPVCIDDFGAGAASFQYLADMQIDYVKFDGSTLDAAMRGTRGQAFLSALTAFCRRLNIKTVAEQVETREHLAVAQACGVDFLQGYLFGRPDPDTDAFRPLPNLELIRGKPVPVARR
jgi:EAL domain-containing protein (putative c-di-GMP-specific phosphodiesterase class I)